MLSLNNCKLIKTMQKAFKSKWNLIFFSIFFSFYAQDIVTSFYPTLIFFLFKTLKDMMIALEEKKLLFGRENK
jgi:hypothetical protein